MAKTKEPEGNVFSLMVLRDTETQAIIEKWWLWLHEEPQRGHRARLRRCATVQAVLSDRAFHRLLVTLPQFEKNHLEAIAVIAGILSCVESDSTQMCASAMGATAAGADRPVISELRFQRLMAADSLESLFAQLRRAVLQLGKKSNPVQIADGILHWHKQHRYPGSYRGQRQWQYCWSRDYYKAIA